jgi:hypothetical protein
MQALRVATILAIFAKSAVAAGTAAMVYSICAFVSIRNSPPWNGPISAELPLWLSTLAATTWPVALGSAVIGQAALSVSVKRTLIYIFAFVASVGASVSAFEWYMTEIVPSVDWSSAWLLPITSSCLSFALVTVSHRHMRKSPSPR